MTDCPNLDFALLAEALSEPARKRVVNCSFKTKVMDFIRNKSPEEIIDANSLANNREVIEYFLDEIEIRKKINEIHRECWQKLVSFNEGLTEEEKLTDKALEDKAFRQAKSKAKAIRLLKINSVIKGLMATGHLRKEKSVENKEGFVVVRTDKQ